jgi:hypothetical protein
MLLALLGLGYSLQWSRRTHPNLSSTPHLAASSRPLVKTHRDVVAHHVVVALPRVKLDGKAARVAEGLGGAAARG